MPLLLASEGSAKEEGSLSTTQDSNAIWKKRRLSLLLQSRICWGEWGWDTIRTPQNHISLIAVFYRTRVPSLFTLVTNWLTNSRLVNLIDVTLACEDGNSKLVEVVTVVDVDDEKRVDNSLVQIWKVKFGHKVKFLFRLWGQGFKVWLRFWSWPSGKILKLNFGHYFAADAWLWLWSSFLVEILVWFGQDF